MPFRSKKEGEKSPLETMVNSFAENAEQINASLGFPGVLLLVSIILFGASALPSTPESAIFLLGLGAVVCLVGSILSYLVQWYFALKSAQEQTGIMRDYMQIFLTRYLESQNKVRPEQIKYAIEDIVLKLTKSDKELSNT